MKNLNKSHNASQNFDNDCNAAGAVTLVSAAFVVNGAEFACRLFDGAGDVVVWHVIRFGFCDNVAELIVVYGIRAAFFDRDCDLATDLREDLAALGIGFFFLILNVRPLGMS